MYNYPIKETVIHNREKIIKTFSTNNSWLGRWGMLRTNKNQFMEAHSLQPCPSCIWSSANTEKTWIFNSLWGISTLVSDSDCLGHSPTSLCAAKAKPELAALSPGPEMFLGAEEIPGGKGTSQGEGGVSVEPLWAGDSCDPVAPPHWEQDFSCLG